MSSFNFDNINELIQNTNNIISCGPDCMQQKKESELKQKYLDAINNKDTADYQISVAAKNYYTFSQGDSGYNTYLDKESESKADNIINDYKTNFSNNFDSISNKIDVYNSIFLNVNNVEDLFKKYEKDNKKLENNLKNKSSDIITNDRKTFYEEEGIKKLDFYYYFFAGVYIIILIIFFLAIIFVNSNTPLFKRVLIFLLLVIYPFFIMLLYNILKKMYNRVKDFVPSNAYRNI